jgi:hypothetical protein
MWDEGKNQRNLESTASPSRMSQTRMNAVLRAYVEAQKRGGR